MNREQSEVNEEIPPCEFLKFPGTPYILGVQKPEKANGVNDPYGLFIGVNANNKQEFNGLIITPPKKEDIEKNTSIMDPEVLKYSGSSIVFDNTGNLLLGSKNLCHIKNCIIGVDNEEKYIYLVHYDKDTTKYTKLWTLPGNIFNLLYLDRVPFNYSFMINDNSECVISKIRLPSYVHDEAEVTNTNQLKLSNDVKFNCCKSSSQKETLEKSYFIKNGKQIYFKDLQMVPSEDRNSIVIKTESTNIGICEGF